MMIEKQDKLYAGRKKYPYMIANHRDTFFSLIASGVQHSVITTVYLMPETQQPIIAITLSFELSRNSTTNLLINRLMMINLRYSNE